MKDLLVRLDPYVRKVGLYTAYTLSSDEYIGDAKTVTDDYYLIYELKERGYEKLSLLEAAKFHPENGEVHHDSFRKVDPESPRWQWHIHLWGTDGSYAEVYSHYEYRPDFRLIDGESVPEAIERLQTHYRPSHGEDYLRGVACDDVKGLVD